MAGTTVVGRARPLRQIRLALVLNGGVSLAIWIGGITYEIDNLRRASAATDDADASTVDFYRRLLRILKEDVVVDVIAGASAGGINGVLLGAAIYNGKPLPNLRETWIGLGDFRTLLRSPSEANPPSLMKGDDVVLVELQRLIDGLYTGGETSLSNPLYVYVVATDLFGYQRLYHDSTGRAFEESDSRRRLTFQSEGEPLDDPGELRNVMRSVVNLGDADAAKLLAAAARSSSSFPVAFEAHQLTFSESVVNPDGTRAENKQKRHWLIDGGVLDNQPFNPVLDRISVIPADRAIKRIVAYIVPYVNEPGSLDRPAPDYATAGQTMSAASTLPRDLPKLESLDRVTAETEAQAVAEKDRRRFWKEMQARPDEIAAAASALFQTYRKTRYTASMEIWNAWAAPDFRAGEGVLGQDPAIDPRAVPALFGPLDVPRAPTDEVPETATWVPQSADWYPDEAEWTWGLAPAERVAAWALRFLDDVTDVAGPKRLTRDLDEARLFASTVVERTRQKKVKLYEAFKDAEGDLSARARTAYEAVDIAAVQDDFRQLDTILRTLKRYGLPVPLVHRLLDLEIVRNAFSIEDPRVPFPFDFLFMSAGIRNSLGHDAESPQTKLAGVKLSHFAGFLKRSWRANDWLWGRLDGVEHVLRALLDLEYLDRLRARDDGHELAENLAAIAFEPSDETRLIEAAWRDALADMTKRERERKVRAGYRVAQFVGNDPDPRHQFVALMNHALDVYKTRPNVARRCIDCCRAALAARIQLQVLDDDLERVAVTATEDVEQGASKSVGSVYWSSWFFERDERLRRSGERTLTPTDQVQLFKSLQIGRERPEDETDSRLTVGIASQIVGVAAAMLAGNRGGLPLPFRSGLASVRGITLPASALTRLLAREPWFGAAVVSVLTGLVLWTALSKSALLGALFPALALAVVVLWLVLFTIATSLFEESLAKFTRVIGFLLLAGIPMAYGVLAGYPGVNAVSDWLDERLSAGVVRVSAVLALAAAAVSFVRLAIAIKPETQTRVPYRYVALGGAGSLLVLVGGLGWSSTWVHDQLDSWVGADTRRVLATTAIALGASFIVHSLLRLTIGTPREWRRKTLSFYRPIVFAALMTVAGGFIAHRWMDQTNRKHGRWIAVANEHKGTILVATILGVLFLAAVSIEVLVPRPKTALDRYFARVRGSATTNAPPSVESNRHRLGRWWRDLPSLVAVAIIVLSVLGLWYAAFWAGLAIAHG
jgi:predicted acylesterase/phospholipase RssA